MRIGIDASALLIASKNGYENYVTNLILALSELDVAELEGLAIYLYFYAGNRLANAALLDTLLPRLRRFTCRIYRPRRGFRIAFPLMVAKDRLDWLHLPVDVWGGRFPCRVVSTFHDACSRRMLMQGYVSPAVNELEQTIQKQLRMSQALIAVSESSKKDLVELYQVPGDRVRVVHHGISDRFKPDLSAARQVREFYDLPSYILSVNALQGNKNYIRLLHAFAELRVRYHIAQILVLVGRDGWDSDVIYAEIEKLQLGSSIQRLGYVPQEHLYGLYAGADLVVNASLCEGFGLPILEAMACGSPVAVANSSSFPEVAGDATLYFDPLSVESIAQVINDVLTNPALSADLSHRGRVRVQQFTWKNTACQTLAAYQALVKQQRLPADGW